jgi:hypothetical protein
MPMCLCQPVQAKKSYQQKVDQQSSENCKWNFENPPIGLIIIIIIIYIHSSPKSLCCYTLLAKNYLIIVQCADNKSCTAGQQNNASSKTTDSTVNIQDIYNSLTGFLTFVPNWELFDVLQHAHDTSISSMLPHLPYFIALLIDVAVASATLRLLLFWTSLCRTVNNQSVSHARP